MPTIRSLHVASLCLLALASSVALGDSEPRLEFIRGEGAAGTLRTVGRYPGDSPRIGQTVTALAGGTVFAYGAVPFGAVKDGELILDPAERTQAAPLVQPGPISWDSGNRGWLKREAAPECSRSTYLHTATLLPSNKILFVGGLCDPMRIANDTRPLPDRAYDGTSLWNQTTQSWEHAPALAQGRLYHTATLLADGRVLIVGGQDDRRKDTSTLPVFASVELFSDADRGQPAKIESLAPLARARAKHTATRLRDDRVLVVGGVDGDQHAIATTEIFDPRSEQWSAGPALRTARQQHSALLLDDGRVMVIGGISETGNAIASVEIFDPRTSSWEEATPLLLPLQTHSAAKLSSGDVLVLGTVLDEYRTSVSLWMLWHMADAQWHLAGTLHSNLSDDVPSAERPQLIPQPDGSALIFGNRSIMQWLPSNVSAANYFPYIERSGAATAVLDDGRLLLAGGRIAHHPTNLAELFDPETNTFTLIQPMRQARYTGMPMQAALASALLKDGRVLIAGGWVWAPDGRGVPVGHSPDIYDPTTRNWSVLSALRFDRYDHVFFNTLQDGRVLFFASRERDEEGLVQFQAWLWNPTTNQLRQRSVGATARAEAGITVLHDGRVLIIGGNTFEHVPEYKCPEPTAADQHSDGDEAESDGCQDEPAHWMQVAQRSAELWDSESGRVAALEYPEGLRENHVQSLVLKNGDVVVVNAEVHSPLERLMTDRAWVWNARTGKFGELPKLPTDHNWPMTEQSDGSLIAWGGDNVSPTYVQRLRPGATAWEQLPRFPQTQATVAAFPSGSIVALSASPPHVTVWNEERHEWDLEQNAYLPMSNAVPIELNDRELAVVGAIFGSQIAIQVWDRSTHRWRMESIPLKDRSATRRALRLPSGAIMNISGAEASRLLCDLWDSKQRAWSACGLFAPTTNDDHGLVALGSLPDGRAVLMTNPEYARVFDETSHAWTTMKTEWNMKLPTGEAIRSGQPFLRLYDEARGTWLEANEMGVKYYDVRAGRMAVPGMLWDRKKQRWAYIRQGVRGDAFWLPDGCAVVSRDLKIYDPSTGRFTPHPEFMMGSAFGAMTVLSDGTVVIPNKEGSPNQVGPGFFYRKASCSGFEKLPGDEAFMPGIFAAPATNRASASPVQPQAVSTSSSPSQLASRIYEYRWIALAILGPLFFYLLVRGGVRLLAARYPNGILTQRVDTSRSVRVGSWAIRIVAYGTVAVIAVPNLIAYWKFRSARVQEQCVAQPEADGGPRSEQIGNCVAKANGFFGTLFSRSKSNVADTLPCRYVGIWSSSRIPTSRITLQDDGRYLFEAQVGSVRQSNGYWEVQGANMVWRHERFGNEPDVNRIVKTTDESFELLEQNGDPTKFELIAASPSQRCPRTIH